MSFIKLDKEIMDIICCPLCKNEVKIAENKIICENCANEFPQHSVNTGEKNENVFDFCIYNPDYCTPIEFKKWDDIQRGYERRSKKGFSRNFTNNYYKSHLKQIKDDKKIYEEFKIKGKVLDVGGHIGKLRHFLPNGTDSFYISIDPFFKVFQDIKFQTDLQKAYPCLSKPCNFLACRAEKLPFIDNTFDWVHMRSVIDHFQNPYIALKEAHRVLKPNGMLLIGASIENKGYDRKKKINKLKKQINPILIVIKLKNKIKKYGFQGIIEAIKLRSTKKIDGHMCKFTHDSLINLLKTTNFSIEKEYQQIPPTNSIYISAKKQNIK